MKKLTLLLLFLLTLFQCSPPANQKKPPIAVKGVLDLREWDFEKDGIVSLDGEWEFYWGEFLEPSIVSARGLQPTDKENEIKYIIAPLKWNNFLHNGKEIGGEGFATYRLIVYYPTVKKMAFKLPYHWTAYKLIVNGKEIATSGQVSHSKELSKPFHLPQIITLNEFSTEMLEIILYISNYHHQKGGFRNSIYLGSEISIQNIYSSSLGMDLFLFGSLLIMGLYHFSIFGLRRKEKFTFYFGLFCILMSIRTLLTGEAYFFHLFPNASWHLGLKLEYLTLYFGTPVFLLFFKELFPEENSYIFLNLILGVSIIFSLIIIFYSPVFFTRTLEIMQITMVISMIYSIYVMILAISRKQQGAKSFFAASLIFSTFIINDLLHTNDFINTGEYAPLGFFIFIFAQSFLLSVRFARAFNQVEDLSENLERKVIERTNQLNQALQKSDKLLLNILPEEVAEELKEKGLVTPVLFESTSIMFTDFKGFTQIAEGLTPQELIKELDACFTQFDKITERYNLEKLKTIGDSYMCAGGIPKVNTTHAIDSCLAALEIQSFMNQMKALKQEINVPYWELRLGIHSGPVMAGVVGEKKFAYDIWGDTVNTASRMESSGTAGRINISYATYELVKDYFDCEYRGEVDAKNKGKVKMYYLNRINQKFAKDELGLVPNEKFLNNVNST